jgi:hypothetical protein
VEEVLPTASSWCVRCAEVVLGGAEVVLGGQASCGSPTCPPEGKVGKLPGRRRPPLPHRVSEHHQRLWAFGEAQALRRRVSPSATNASLVDGGGIGVEEACNSLAVHALAYILRGALPSPQL